MASEPYQAFSYRSDTSLSSRLTSILLALGISVLIILMLLELGVVAPRNFNAESRLVTIDLVSGSKSPVATHSRSPQLASHTPKTSTHVSHEKAAVPPPAHAKGPIPWIEMKGDDFAASDISKIPSQPAQSASADGAGSGQDSASAYGPGEGPNGERLYNAQWYREPSDVELGTYLPHGVTEPAWAMIACKTVEKFHVEDCQELGESPPGSGLARALRQAAWQFLVRPPRIGGRSQVGAWVRIRFDFTRDGAKARRG
jgi:protein TonB